MVKEKISTAMVAATIVVSAISCNPAFAENNSTNRYRCTFDYKDKDGLPKQTGIDLYLGPRGAYMARNRQISLADSVFSFDGHRMIKTRFLATDKDENQSDRVVLYINVQPFAFWTSKTRATKDRTTFDLHMKPLSLPETMVRLEDKGKCEQYPYNTPVIYPDAED